MQDKWIIKIHKDSDLKIIFSWLPALFFLANIYRMTGHSSLPYLFLLSLCGIVGNMVLFFGKTRKPTLLYMTVIIWTISGLLNYYFIGNSDMLEISSNIMYFGLMMIMFAYPMTYTQGFITFYSSIAIFIVGYISGAHTHTFLTSSGNYISVLIILAAALYYITVYASGHEFSLIDILPSLLCFFISIWAKGRGGILCCSILLILTLLYYIIKNAYKSSRRMLLISIISIIVIIIIAFNEINIIDSYLSLGKWSSRGFDMSSRGIIWGSYINKVKESILYFLLGAPTDQIQIIQAFNNNPHNSFIQLHATNGIIPFLLFIFLLCRAVIYYFKEKNALLLIALIVVTTRGITDKFIFGQYGMPIIMYLVLYPYFEESILGQGNSAFMETWVKR